MSTKKKEYTYDAIKTKIFFTFLVLTLVLPVTIYLVDWAVQNRRSFTNIMYGAYGSYGGNVILSDNDQYLGYINEKEHIVMITDKKGNCVSKYNSKEMPKEIALGINSYFLLYRDEEQERESAKNTARIVQLDYQSNVIKERMADGISTIAYKNGLLFLAEWLSEEDCEDCIYRFHQRFSAKYYIAEENFQDENCPWNEIGEKAEYMGMYYHSQNFFATEPELQGYPGMVENGFFTGQNPLAMNSQREKNNFKLMNKEIVNKNKCELDYFYKEYQMGEKVYGVCNTFRNHTAEDSSLVSNEVYKSYTYVIDCNREDITILDTKDDALEIYTTANENIFQRKNKIIKKDYRTNAEEV